MILNLEQVFYGCGPHGYGVLGFSPGAEGLIPRVESVCVAVGTPNSDWDGTPFLLSVPDGDRVIMVLCQRGAPDSMRRNTLFFHALIAEKHELSAAKADAFSLFDQGMFAAADVLPFKSVPSLSIKPKSCPMRPHSLGDDIPIPLREGGLHFPAAIRSTGVPDPNEVREFIGRKANELAWATYAFRCMDGFSLQVLPLPASVSPYLNEYAGNMPMLSIGLVRDASSCLTTAPSSPLISGNNGHFPVPDSSAKRRTALTALWCYSVANVVLLIACIALFILWKRTVVRQLEPSIQIPISQEEQERFREEGRHEILCSLPPTFTFDECKENIPNFETNPEGSVFLEKLAQWSRYLETNTFKDSPQ